MTRVYLSGPITGKPALNKPAFDLAEVMLKASGYRVINPFEVAPNPKTWEEAMREDIAALLTCEAIALLPGWESSRGAKLERHIALQLGMREIFIVMSEAGMKRQPCGRFG